MSRSIMDYIRQCPQCQLQGNKTKLERLNPIPVTNKPFERIGIDVKHVSTSLALDLDTSLLESIT